MKRCVLFLSVAVALILIERQIMNNVLAHQGYGSCYKCHKTWDVVREHVTRYGDAHFTVTTPMGENSAIQVVGVTNDGGTHQVTVINGDGCFPLCESCWMALKTPDARLPYYRRLVDDWTMEEINSGESEKKWPLIKASVLSGN